MSEYEIAMLGISGVTLVTTFFVTRNRGRKLRQTPVAEADKLPNIVAVQTRRWRYTHHCAHCGREVGGTICTGCGMWWCAAAGLEVAFRRKRPSRKEVTAYVQAKQE